MAFTKPHSISQAERDLRDYASQKAYALMRDVVQSFEIAGLSKMEAGACLGALFMRISAAMAVETHAHKKPLTREAFMRYCEQCYDGAMKIKDEDEVG